MPALPAKIVTLWLSRRPDAATTTTMHQHHGHILAFPSLAKELKKENLFNGREKFPGKWIKKCHILLKACITVHTLAAASFGGRAALGVITPVVW